MAEEGEWGGRSFWEDLSADAALSASFDALMGSDVAAEAPAIVSCLRLGIAGACGRRRWRKRGPEVIAVHAAGANSIVELTALSRRVKNSESSGGSRCQAYRRTSV